MPNPTILTETTAIRLSKITLSLLRDAPAFSIGNRVQYTFPSIISHEYLL